MAAAEEVPASLRTTKYFAVSASIPIIQPIPEPAVIDYEDEEGWPDPPLPQQGKIYDEEAQKLMALLDASISAMTPLLRAT